jgi:hypothetical protein
MKNKNKTYTPQEVIRWLSRNHKKTARFGYYNDNHLGCLFTRFLRSVTKNKNLIACAGGGIKNEKTGKYFLEVIPFHDAFWNLFRDNGLDCSNVSQKEAIRGLRKILTLTKDRVPYIKVQKTTD